MNSELMIQQYLDVPLTIPTALILNYKNLGLNEEQFLLILHIRCFSQQGNHFPTPNELQARMSIDEVKCTSQLKELLQKGFLQIEEKHDEDGRLAEAFSLKPLYEKLTVFLTNETIDEKKDTRKNEEGQLFRRFEEEFSRPITPMEMEMISMWLDEDGHIPQMIEAALREAVVSSKLNFRYIDRILYEWKRNGVRTTQQAREHGERIRQHQQQPKINNTEANGGQFKRRHPQYNWLQGEKR
ncbi:DnaD domain-containing protein [Evansella sp. AB-P1]|uniref:DnaD domain-containing protein n=1 Tax=Evansella sp. AB-P1 TaxID=3037653 RepID=UPI00241FDB56|nr:DnaD domain-containing protein [Evansella sp. AB-P1]MDG5787555.1 DnaD domain-containing protein [Evansella sp. AB-P1]